MYLDVGKMVRMTHYSGRVLDWTYSSFCAVYLIFAIYDGILTYEGTPCDPDRPPIDAAIVILILSITMMPILILNRRILWRKDHSLTYGYRIALLTKFWISAFVTASSFCVGLIFTILDLDYLI